MEKESFNTIDDLVFNPSFCDWVLNRKTEGRAFWDDWIVKHPEKVLIVNEARAMVFALQLNHPLITDKEIDEEARILEGLAVDKSAVVWEESEIEERRSPAVIRKIFTFGKVAAAVIVIMSVWFLFRNFNAVDPAESYTSFVKATGNSAVEYINHSDSLLNVALADGSKVVLSSNSKLVYDALPGNTERKVFLTGTGFFEVKKDPSKPFIVFTRDMVTKVLGTSFLVRAPEGEKLAVVSVKTGRVSVFKKNHSEAAVATNENAGKILVANQQVVFDREKQLLTKSLVDRPEILRQSEKHDFDFKATPLSDVFNQLQQYYGIRIIFDEELLSSCSLSARLGEESFFDKLDLICSSINSKYEEIDGDVIITSQGCK